MGLEECNQEQRLGKSNLLYAFTSIANMVHQNEIAN